MTPSLTQWPRPHDPRNSGSAPYFDAGITANGKPYIVMPLVRGQDLRSAASSVPLGDCLAMFCEVASGLAYAHDQNVLHRDLKPSNVIVRESDNQPLILDFGSAYVLDQMDSRTLTTHAVGTAGYIPSEVLADPSIRSPLHDVYSCGVMLYETLAGRRPDPNNYTPLGSTRAECSVVDALVKDAVAGANRRISASELALRLDEMARQVMTRGAR